MIVLPLLALAIGVGLLRLASTPKRPVVSGGIGGAIRVPRQPRKYRTMLAKCIKSGRPATRWLVSAAAAEACEAGDARTLYWLSNHFGKAVVQCPMPSQQSEAELPTTDSEPTLDPSLEEMGESELKSPIDGVENEDWADFVSRLRTKPPGHRSDKYVGQYEQNRERLRRLGIPEPTTPDEEHEALAKDMGEHARSSAKLINQWSGDVMTINGVEHPICASGILGLLKSAGADGAESWLTNEADRAKYPKTTEAFLRSNGCF